MQGPGTVVVFLREGQGRLEEQSGTHLAQQNSSGAVVVGLVRRAK